MIASCDAERGRAAGTGPSISVNLFAGGGGASLGELEATGRSPTIAVNHWPVAIAIHQANNPTTEHYIEDVYAVDPRVVAAGRRVGFLWMSPTCTHFSRASGAALKDQKIRGLAWSIMPWIVHARPDVIVLENVPEFLTWGPLHRRHAEGCDGDEARCAKHCRYGRPIRSRAGETFRAWKRKIESKGYSFEARKLVAWEYGAPTTRERVYIIMRADGHPATWPAPTHAREPSAARPHRWRTAADIIDWSIPCPSIFGRKKALVEKTEARLVRGVGKYVLEAARPFLLKVNDVQAPHPTVVAEGEKTALTLAFLARYNGQSVGQDPDHPLGTLDTRDRYAVVSARCAGPVDDLLATWTPEVERRARQVYHLMLRHGHDGPGMDHEAQLVTVQVDGQTLVIWDLGLRMLTARELFLAQGFSPSYVIDPIGPNGRRVTHTEQIRACGNSVCPPVARAIVRAVLGISCDPTSDNILN